MRRVLLICLLACGAACGQDAGALYAVLARESWNPAYLAPVAWWRGDGNALDSSGVYNGTWTGTAAYATGLNQQAFSFNGASHVGVGGGTAFNLYPMTISFWMQSTNTHLQYSSIIDKYSTGSLNGWQVWLDTSGCVRFWYFAGSALNSVYGGGDGLLFDPNTATTGAWVHYAIVVDAAGGRIYRNAVQVDSQAWTGTAAASSANLAAALGRHNFSTGRYYRGLLDDAIIFDRALSLSEIEKIYGWRK